MYYDDRASSDRNPHGVGLMRYIFRERTVTKARREFERHGLRTSCALYPLGHIPRRRDMKRTLVGAASQTFIHIQHSLRWVSPGAAKKKHPDHYIHSSH